MNREAWLAAFVEKLRPLFDAAHANLPQELRVSVGFPSRGALSAKSQKIGQCWDGSAASDGVHQIFISPLLADAVRVGDVLVHELVHAALPKDAGHKAPFKRLAEKLGLEGKPTATHAGAELTSRLAAIVGELGAYPHAGLSAATLSRKKQTTRLRKAECEKCHYTVRVTSKWLEKGTPICPVDNIPMGAEEESE